MLSFFQGTIQLLGLLLFLLVIHYPLLGLLGLAAHKRFPATRRQGRYAVVIGARNEERVIEALLNSIRACDYPQELLTVYVAAHNCTDRTAELARRCGARVYAYDNPAERTVGFAYRFLFDRMREEPGFGEFDGVFVINADNTLSPDYFRRMNEAFWYYRGRAVVTSFRNSVNFGDNTLSCLYGMFFLAACRFEARGRALLGLSTRVSGTGYVLPAALVREGWPFVTLTEDWEFTADQIARGTRITYCDEAEFFDEQPTAVPVMLAQRMRWAKGHMIVFFRSFASVLGSVFRRGRTAGQRFSSFDTAVSLLPLGVIGVVLMLASLALNGMAALRWLLIGTAWSYGTALLGAVLLLIVERRRIRDTALSRQAAAALLWPFFVGLNIVLDVAALLVRRVEWRAIPHGSRRK